MTYRIRGLDPAPFRPLFGLPDEELAESGIIRMTVDSPTFPCRVSLTDRAIGEKVLLLNHVSHDVREPLSRQPCHLRHRGRGGSSRCVDQVPPVFEKRVLSLRGFDADGHDGRSDPQSARRGGRGNRRLFANPDIATIHAHNATRGCFAARIERN